MLARQSNSLFCFLSALLGHSPLQRDVCSPCGVVFEADLEFVGRAQICMLIHTNPESQIPRLLSRLSTLKKGVTLLAFYNLMNHASLFKGQRICPMKNALITPYLPSYFRSRSFSAFLASSDNKRNKRKTWKEGKDAHAGHAAAMPSPSIGQDGSPLDPLILLIHWKPATSPCNVFLPSYCSHLWGERRNAKTVLSDGDCLNQ